MRIKYSPQVSDNEINYTFDDDKIIATYNNQTDTFDFSKFSDGIMLDVETTLDINPIVSAKRVDDILFVELINFIDNNASHADKYPDWVGV